MTSYHFKLYLRIARYLMIAIALLLIVFLISKDLVLSGKISYSTDFTERSAFFTELVPLQRVENTKEGVKIIADPIYTTFRYPRPFQEVVATTEFTNPDGAFIEYGYQNAPGESFHLQALNHPQLNLVIENQATWSGLAIDSAGTINGVGEELYQKRSAPYIYAGVDQFWADLPEQQRTGYYGVDIQQPYIPQPKSGGFSTTYPLRGGHTFLVAPTREVLDITFTFADLNLVPGADDVLIQLVDWQGNILLTESYDDSIELQSLAEEGMQIRLRSEEVSNDEVVKVRFITSDEVVITSLTANTPYFVAEGAIWIAGGATVSDRISIEKIDTESLYVSSRSWVASTPQRESVQRIYVGSETLHVEQPLQPYRYQKPLADTYILSRGYAVVIEQGNIQLQARGVFGFSEESYFTPYPWYIDDTLELDNSDIAYIITDYLPPSRIGEQMYTQSIYIDLADAFAPEKQLRTQFSVPHHVNHQPIILHKLMADYRSDSVTFSNAREKAMRFIERELK